ncbi:MAG TPA: hypothetical protein VGH00_10015, partial [Chthoniobacterales bacterium]
AAISASRFFEMVIEQFPSIPGLRTLMICMAPDPIIPATIRCVCRRGRRRSHHCRLSQHPIGRSAKNRRRQGIRDSLSTGA